MSGHSILAPGPLQRPDAGSPRPGVTLTRPAVGSEVLGGPDRWLRDDPARFRVAVTAPTRGSVEIVAPLTALRARLAITDMAGLVTEAHRRSEGLVTGRGLPHWEPFPAGAAKVFDVSPRFQYPDLAPGRYRMVVRVRYRWRTRAEDDWAIGVAESDAVTFDIPAPAGGIPGPGPGD